MRTTPLIATSPLQTGQSRANRPDTALGGLWESSVQIAVSVPRGAFGSWPVGRTVWHAPQSQSAARSRRRNSPRRLGTAVDKVGKPAESPPWQRDAYRGHLSQFPLKRSSHREM